MFDAVGFTRMLGGVHVNDFASRGWFRDGLATLFETFEVKLDGISNEGQRFLSCFTSSDTAGQIGHVRAK
jgi:hypothetical protein